jgi:hypothetical protein
VFAVFPQSSGDVTAFKSRMKLNIKSVANVPLSAVGVTATPTIVLVAPSGVILRSWVGSEGEQSQKSIYSAFVSGS